MAPKVQETALFHLPAGCGIVPFILESLIFHSRRVFSCDPGSKFHIVTNIRQASVTDEIGIVCLELQGGQADVKASIHWLEKQGVNVEPVEISVVES